MGLDENYLSFPKRASSIKFLVSLIPYNEIKEPILGPSLWPSNISYRLLNQSLRFSKLFSLPIEKTSFWISSDDEDYGYVFIDSNSNHELAPDYEWIEINQIGTNLNLTDDSHTIIPIDFDFRFYGEDYNEITVG